MSIGGIIGKNLNIDLTNGTTEKEFPSEWLYKNMLGGYGIGAYIVCQRQKAFADALGPENILGFATGPLTGTQAITGNRFTVFGKSPKTLTWGDANSGGSFGPGLKFAGYDGIYIRGAADGPVLAQSWEFHLPWRTLLRLCGESPPYVWLSPYGKV